MIERRSLRPLIVMVLMLVAASLAMAAKPRTRVADSGPRTNLETLIPTKLGDWSVDESIVPVQAAPDTRAALARIYSQTLARTYINSKGDRVMLSVAYGGDQSDAMQVHKPEICYPAQGFSVVSILTTYLATQFGQLPVKRLVAVHGARVEPITYWITVGDRVARTGWEQKIAQLRYGLTGKIPDGLLFRVSSIDRDEARAYEIQSEFVRSVLSSLTASDRARLVGTFGA